MSEKKYLYSILTVNTGNYECIREVQHPNPNVEYVCVTDNPNLISNTWKIIYKPNIWFLYVKHHQYEFISTDVCLWLDGSYQITDDPTNSFVLPFINSDKEFMISIHDVRHNIYEEVVWWWIIRKVPYENIQTLYNILLYNNIHSDTLFQTSCMLSKNTEFIKEIFDNVVKLEELCSVIAPYRDDQAILSAVISKYNELFLNKIVLMNFEYTSNNKYFHWCKHGSNDINPVKQMNFICFDKYQSMLYCIK